MKKKMDLRIALLIASGFCIIGGIALICTWNQWKKTETVCNIPDRPAIYDRCGNLLIGNRQRTNQPNERLRYAAVDGKFAAAFLGWTEFQDGRERGRTGIEAFIDSEHAAAPVYVSLDSGVQEKVEHFAEYLNAAGKSNYLYTVCIDSNGELIATAQRDVLDINNRKHAVGTCFFPANYLFPVAGKFLQFLTDPAAVSPESISKLQLTEKTGCFSPEVQGRIKFADSKYTVSATAFKYLLANISVKEKKPVPQLKIFSDGKQNPVEISEPEVKWIVDAPGDEIIAALTEISTENNGSLYVFVCIGVDKKDPENREKIKAAISEKLSF